MGKTAPQKKTKRIYWDSCVFLSLIEGTPERLPQINSVLDDMEKRLIEIHTSLFSIAEVAFGKSEKDGAVLSPYVQRKIDRLWDSHSPFRVSEVYKSVATDAQQLVRHAMAQGLRLTPPDAVHLATARKLKVSEFHTYDGFSGKTAEIERLTSLKIKTPHVVGKIVWGDDDGPKEPAKKKRAKRS